MKRIVAVDSAYNDFVPFAKLVDDFVTRPLSEWESAYSQMWKVDVKMLRAILHSTLVRQGYTEMQCKWYYTRYYHGHFDSVGDYFVMVDVKIPTLCVLPPPSTRVVSGWMFQDPFVVSLCRQDEISPCSILYSSMKDLDYLTLQTFDFQSVSLVMRPKLNGTPFFKVRHDKQTYMVGSGFAVKVEADFPVEMFEWTSEGSFVIRPYAFNVTMMGMDFLPHSWVPVDSLTVMTYDHGVVFCCDGVEIRSRRVPTVEIDISSLSRKGASGVWEVSGEDFRLHRPRPGKPAMSHDKARDALSFSVPLSVLSLPVLSVACVRNVTDGPYVGSRGVTDGVPWFDSGLRITDGHVQVAQHVASATSGKTVLSTDIYHHEFSEGRVSSPYMTSKSSRVVTGAKLLLFDSDDNTYLIKDAGKALDLVGGKVEWMESSLDTLMREVKEEIGLVHIEPKVVCVSSQYTPEAEFHSVVFVAPMPINMLVSYDEFHLVKFRGFEYDYKQSVAWLPRLIQAISARAGGFSTGLPKLYASLPMVKYRPKRDLGVMSYRDAKTIKKQL